jgi:hypothetical protein
MQQSVDSEEANFETAFLPVAPLEEEVLGPAAPNAFNCFMAFALRQGK